MSRLSYFLSLHNAIRQENLSEWETKPSFDGGARVVVVGVFLVHVLRPLINLDNEARAGLPAARRQQSRRQQPRDERQDTTTSTAATSLRHHWEAIPLHICTR